MTLQGTVTALITPFREQQLDTQGLIDNIRHQIAGGVNGVLVLGTTGEAATLSAEEQESVINIAVTEAAGKVPVWVGTGSNCTRQTITKTLHAKALGADVALIVTPYYNKPGQEGIYRHFEAIAHSVDIPIVVYNIPGRCGVNIETETLQRIAGLPNIVGVKEASGNISQAGDVLYHIVSEHPHFRVFSGDDALTLPMMALGAVGVVSVVSNLIPAHIAAMVDNALAGRFYIAREIHYQLLPIFKAAFVESNPVAIKAAMELCGMAAGSCRLPLNTIAENNLHMLRRLLRQMQLINDMEEISS